MKNIKVNEKSFNIIKLLGKGKGGYSYLVSDDNNDKYVVKKIHHEPCSYYSFGDKLESEMNDYKHLSKVEINIPKLIDVDKENEHILKEYINGDTIYDMVKANKDVSKYIIEVKEMCKKLYKANTNIDYFPTNFVSQDGKLYYIDYECNEYMEEWNFENWGINYWSKTKEFVNYVNKEVVKKFFNEGYNKKDFECIRNIVAKDYYDHSPAGARSNEDAISILKGVANVFADFKCEILDLTAENDMVAGRFKFEGIHIGEFIGVKASNKKVSFEALENFKIKDGIIIESWGYWPDAQIKSYLEGK